MHFLEIVVNGTLSLLVDVEGVEDNCKPDRSQCTLDDERILRLDDDELIGDTCEERPHGNHTEAERQETECGRTRSSVRFQRVQCNQST